MVLSPYSFDEMGDTEPDEVFLHYIVFICP